MKILKYIGLTSLITSYIFLILSYIIDKPEISTENLFNIAWGLGILSVISNLSYAIKMEFDEWLISVFGFSGLVWFVPFFLDFDFGILEMSLYLIIGIFIHLNLKTKKEKTA